MTNWFFTICKCKLHFSNIITDQAHEENNKFVKIDGGATGIFENESALLKWVVAGPMVSDMLKKADVLSGKTSEFNHHHEENESYNKNL